ncbi:MAG: TetR family transcriptional regulator [Nonomuraea sp.]|nr:TetR family transcriptional regulator [Nonomuraea sp.]NUP65172.1 TetR family transcriptional regulator [Nonomuraea sp.]NUP78469.1 TetR family transcriptional regulator [Nonomuraea sp.]NUS03588.1 TetR family transcriptional regulator [Nonomuraea sp.]NUT09953.1 TetR family transcriptional regulator [Nonomuraea sp.]
MARQRLLHPREQMLQAAMAAIAEHGSAQLTMAALGRRLDTSGGHLLYYFGSKDQLLLETLKWSEEQLAPRRKALLELDAPERDRLRAYVELYAPERAGDPRWLLWVDVWSRTASVPELRDAQADLDRAWHDTLVTLLPGPGADSFSVRLRAMLDGFSTQLVIGVPGITREAVVAHALALLPPVTRDHPASETGAP